MNPELAYETVTQTLKILAPELVLLAVSIAMMTLSPFVQLTRQAWCAVAAGGLVASLVALLLVAGIRPDPYSAIALNDSLGFYGRLVAILTGLVLLGLAHREPPHDRSAEFFGAFLMIDAGAMIVSTANELVFLFVGLELVSIPTYLLLYLSRRSTTTQETATKYFYLSIFSSGLLLFGLAYLYGMTGVSNLKAVAELSWKLSVPNPQLGLIAVVFVVAGLSFRVAAVPFHFYAPDVYQGSPTVIAALLSWVPKGVGFVAMVRVLTSVFAVKGPLDPLVEKAVLLCWFIAAATMIVGNTMALLQNDLKRLLAYSSIAHAGYLMIGATVAFSNGPNGGGAYYGSEGIFFYLVAYALMTLGAFGTILALRTPTRPVETVEDLDGLSATQPLPALGLAICLLSLSGIPPLLGFLGKFTIFASAFAANTDQGFGMLVGLAILGVLNSAVGAYYYLRIVVGMYLKPSRQKVEATGGWPVAAAVGACVTLTLVLGFYPLPIARASREAAVAAVGRDIPAPTSDRIAAERAPAESAPVTSVGARD
ncbi:NADH-quinone oxidoreductase subunit N [Aquisphaera giovannonii]|uniref:NADH-quinone oxidoreductase subunit N n=1 Tax=Aquisphaera giovannonii TaxID=406548 RepID=A0A5B9W0L2_9BACT|nr:NADH-quinone oxidoreductase subunit N [Aquisphaera giovannonii]QEH33754.1 NADH-quinone oxidoreductase subunit N [Aquisphaera giovannonii]